MMAASDDILRAAVKHRMFASGDAVLAAVSGGPDSVAMLHALHARACEFGITLRVAHMNHGIRGDDSDADEAFVRDLAARMAVPITVERVSVPRIRMRMRAGEEEAARVIRYSFLQETASDFNCTKIAVGHTADDRAETVLLNVLRGAGIEGLGSMRPVTGKIVRPLIDTWRCEIEAYLDKHGLEYKIDATNLDTGRVRNRVRHVLIPILERDYNPQVKAALVRLARIAESVQELVERLAGQALLGVEYRSAIDARLLSELPRAIVAEIVRSELEQAKGGLTDVTFDQIERVVDALGTGEDFTITLPSGKLYAERLGEDFRIGSGRRGIAVKPFERALAVPGRTRVPGIGLTIDAEIRGPFEIPHVRPNVAVLDADTVTGSLRVRNVLPGDRIRPFGMRGTKKLQDLFVDKRIPPSERARAAVVVDDEKLVWVVGIAASESCRVTDKTQRIIRLAAVPGR
ncbi:MAG: tRNA lysidine(34) synthetase TilS [Armatimonadota bacterium]